MKKLKLSPWHSGDVKPFHIGVYQKEAKDGSYWYSWWNGEYFSGGFYKKEDAAIFGKNSYKSPFKHVAWRGILK